MQLGDGGGIRGQLLDHRQRSRLHRHGRPRAAGQSREAFERRLGRWPITHRRADLVDVAVGRGASRVVTLSWEVDDPIARKGALAARRVERSRAAHLPRKEVRKLRVSRGGAHQLADHRMARLDVGVTLVRTANRGECVSPRAHVPVFVHVELGNDRRGGGDGGVHQLRVEHAEPARQHARIGTSKRHPFVGGRERELSGGKRVEGGEVGERLTRREEPERLGIMRRVRARRGVMAPVVTMFDRKQECPDAWHELDRIVAVHRRDDRTAVECGTLAANAHEDRATAVEEGVIDKVGLLPRFRVARVQVILQGGEVARGREGRTRRQA